MTSPLRAPAGKVGLRPTSYEAFGGLDTSRPAVNMDTPRNLHFTTFKNGYIDWRGQVITDPPVKRRTQAPRTRVVRFFADNEFCTVTEDQSGFYNLGSSRGHVLNGAFPRTDVPSTAVFNRQVHFLARGRTPYFYDGSIFRPHTLGIGRLGAAFGATVARRLALAGMPNALTRVEISRVDQTTLSTDEQKGEVNVLRGGFIDVANLLGRNDRVTGLGSFEQDRLVIFSQDSALLYRIDPNIDNWAIDERANIKVGCISHNSIVSAGVDVIFAARSGVHNIQRSPDNGILVYSRTLTDKIETLYRSLVRGMEDPENISAVFDQDDGRYYLFFPQPNGIFSNWLSLSLNPEEGQVRPSWSAGTTLNATCGDFLGGRLVLGCADGAYEVVKFDDPSAIYPVTEVVTPYLWHSNILETKESHSLILQAAGQGSIDIEAYNDTEKLIWSRTVEVDGQDNDNLFEDVPLFQSYDMPFQHRYRGVRLRFNIRSAGTIRLFGFAITYRS